MIDLREGDLRASLFTEATNKGVTIDRSWPLDRIREEIDEHDAAVRLARASIAARKAKRNQERGKGLSFARLTA